jgi:prepilin-type N-terminal cleavage/methylation domain-containing protein
MIIEKIRSNKGVTFIELMIAALITGIIAVAAFNFYGKMQGQSVVQSDVSDIQLICRNSVLEMKKMARMAGFKVGLHPAYEISGDTLSLYMHVSQPVDTVRYFLAPMASPNPDDDGNTRAIFSLMKQVNSSRPVLFADYLTQLTYANPDSSTLMITVTAETSHRDLDYHTNNGYHQYTLTEKINFRNINL